VGAGALAFYPDLGCAQCRTSRPGGQPALRYALSAWTRSRRPSAHTFTVLAEDPDASRSAGHPELRGADVIASRRWTIRGSHAGALLERGLLRPRCTSNHMMLGPGASPADHTERKVLLPHQVCPWEKRIATGAEIQIGQCRKSLFST
jgi:hypothetical protein